MFTVINVPSYGDMKYCDNQEELEKYLKYNLTEEDLDEGGRLYYEIIILEGKPERLYMEEQVHKTYHFVANKE